MNRNIVFLLLVICLGVVLPLRSANAQDAVSLSVDPSASLGAISPYVYGSNLQNSVIPPKMMDKAKATGIKFLRWGGGDSDRKDLEKSSIDLFMYQVKQLGAEPLMTVRLLNGTPEAAAEDVRYANIEKGYNITYWSIGNEPNIFTEVMKVDKYTAQDLASQWRVIAEAMRKVDPNIKFMGPDITGYVVLDATPGSMKYLDRALGGHSQDNQGTDWLQEFLRVNADLLDVVTIHRYPYPGAARSSTAGATIEGLQEVNKEWDIAIPNLRAVIKAAAGRDIPIGVTEFNSHSGPSSGAEASLDSFYNAIWMSDVLGRLISHKVEFVASWDFQGVANHPWGLITRDGVRPSYYAYIMYTHFGTELLTSQSSDPSLSIYTAKRADGTLTVMVINPTREARSVTLSVKGMDAPKAAETWRLDPEHNAEQIGTDEALNGTLTLPGQSVTLYVINP